MPEGYTVNDIKRAYRNVLLMNDGSVYIQKSVSGEEGFYEYESLKEFDKTKIIDVIYEDSEYLSKFYLVCDDNCLYVNS